jgi:hypothetical protein
MGQTVKKNLRTVMVKPIPANPSLKTYPLQLSFVFAIAGSIGLAIAVGLDLKTQWVTIFRIHLMMLG